MPMAFLSIKFQTCPHTTWFYSPMFLIVFLFAALLLEMIMMKYFFYTRGGKAIQSSFQHEIDKNLLFDFQCFGWWFWLGLGEMPKSSTQSFGQTTWRRTFHSMVSGSAHEYFSSPLLPHTTCACDLGHHHDERWHWACIFVPWLGASLPLGWEECPYHSHIRRVCSNLTMHGNGDKPQWFTPRKLYL